MGLPERIRSMSLIGIDTSIFIYHLEAHPTYLPFTQELLSGIAIGHQEAVTSIITLMEIYVRPIQSGRWDIARKYETLLVDFPHLTIVDIDRNIARYAAQLRAEHRLRPADALQVAACYLNGAEIFMTNDKRLERLTPIIDIAILDDFAQ